MADEANYLIWSNEQGAWWRSKGRGYTVYLSNAGRYSRDEALSICRSSRNGWRIGSPPSEIPVLAADAAHCEVWST